MFELLLFLVVFGIVLFILLLLYDNALKKDKISNIKSVVVLIDKFKLDKKKVDNKKLLNGVAIINSFIISETVVLVDMLGIYNIIWFVVAFINIVIMILICYTIYGKMLIKKWGKKDGV